MPRVIDPHSAGTKSPGPGTTAGLRETDHGYDYPEEQNWRPGFEKHDKLVSRVMQYARESYDRMSRRHNDWREIDRVLKAYTYLPSPGGSRAKKGEDELGEQKDDIRRIVMPVSYVVLETLLTYFTTAFLQQPIFEYEGSGPEDVLGGMLLTHTIQKQVHRNAVPLALHTAWRDMFAYGVGYASPIWHQEMGRVVQKRPTGFLDGLRGMFLQTGEERVLSDYEVLFEGNKLVNIDPYLALPDPNVAAHEVQDGEFFGWIDESTLSGLMREEASPSGDFFNVKYLRELGGELTSTLQNRGDRSKRKNDPPSMSSPVDIVYMYVDLFPEDWELPGGDMPETWVFAIAADKVLVKAERLNLAHGKLPIAAGAPDTDGYSATPLSRLMAIEEMQGIIDFLYTSHVENIKRVLNDSIVYDPTLINTFDLNDNRPGRRIRLRKRAWGKGGIKDNAIFQLDIQDVTQQNVQEALFLMEQAKGATSTMENLAGQMAPRTTRISASESQSTRMSGLARLERPAQLVSYQFMLPIARMFASNAQQFMSQEVYVKTVGELEQRMREELGMKPPPEGRMQVQPFDLLVNYDINAHDGAVPGKTDPQIFTEFFQVLAQSPQLAEAFDIVRVAKTMFREMGLKNVDQYIRRQGVEVMPDEEVAQNLDRGNLAPVGGDGAV